MFYEQLFDWWIGSIVFNIVFVIVASVYIYSRRRQRETEPLNLGQKITRVAENFVFVWVLLGLLVFYVFSVGEGSYLLFAVGNVVVEALLLVYVYVRGKS